MADTQVVNLILLALRDRVTDAMQTSIPPGDITRADVVKLGLLFDNKLSKNIQVGINAGDHDQPEEQDGIVGLEKLPKVAMRYPAREIGGGQIWMRRGTVRLECFFVAKNGLTEDQAFENAHIVMGRLQHAIDTTPVASIARDTFGERPISIHCFASSFFESGGPPSSYIFRGKAWWAAFTDKQ